MPIEFDAPATATATAPAPGLAATWRKLATPRLGVKERMMFTERLSLLLETGVPLHAALQALREQSERSPLGDTIAAIGDEIVAGARFSAALARHPDLFPSTYVNLVSASEGGGFLAEVLVQLVEMDEKEQRLRGTLASALSYPLFLMAFSTLVVLFILVWVFPQFTQLFAAIQDQLPWTTKLLMALSGLLTQHAVPLLIGVAACVGAAATLVRRPEVSAQLDRLKLRVPLLRDIFIKIYLTRLLRVMGVSLEHGVTILATLEACRDVVPNADIRAFIAGLETDVTEGKGIAGSFSASPFIPIAVRQMIATGEATGTLGRVMGKVADSYDRDLSRQLAQLSRLAEPVMLLIMGVMVGTIVTSLILPIFKLSRAVH